MAVSDHMRPGISQRGRIQIVTVDTSQRRVEGSMKDGSMLQIAIWDVSSAFRWPVEGEIWTVYKDTGIWMLGTRVQDGVVSTDDDGVRTKEPEPAPIEGLNPGDMKLDSSRVVDNQGRAFLVDATSQSAPGDLKMTASTRIPSGWLECDGSEVDRVTEADLFAAIGTSWGVGDGSTTFNLPDFQGRGPVGAGTGAGRSARSVGQTGGEEAHTLLTAEAPSHAHGGATGSGATGTGVTGNMSVNANHGHSSPDGLPFGTTSFGLGFQWTTFAGPPNYSFITNEVSTTTNVNLDHTHTVPPLSIPSLTIASSGGNGAHNNMAPFGVVTWLIKT